MKNGQFVDVTEIYDEMLGAFKRLKNNSDLAIMCVDNRFVLVNTKDNKFNIIKELKKVDNYHKWGISAKKQEMQETKPKMTFAEYLENYYSKHSLKTEDKKQRVIVSTGRVIF